MTPKWHWWFFGGGGAGDTRPTLSPIVLIFMHSRSNCSHYHAVFGKSWSSNRLHPLSIAVGAPVWEILDPSLNGYTLNPGMELRQLSTFKHLDNQQQ